MSYEEILDRIKCVFCDIFDVNETEIKLDTTAEDIPGWDSMNQIILIASLEDELSIHFDMGDYAELKSISQIVDYIKKRL